MILMYHQLGKESGFNMLPFHFFDEHIAFLQDHYQCLSMDEYVSRVRTRTLLPQHITISFDDAYVDAMRHLLLKHTQLPAIVYIPVQFIGRWNTWDVSHQYAIADAELLSELLLSTTTKVGSHGQSHQRLAKMDNEEIKKEITESKRLLEQLTSTTITHFSFPFGQKKDVPPMADKYLADAGYQSAVTTLYGGNLTAVSPYGLKRIEIEPGDTAVKLRSKLKGLYFAYRVSKQLIKNLV